MKQSKSIIAGICMFLALSAGSVWAEWEGNAGIAAAGEFPLSGMYARSDMFPKNTVVEIRNLETEITVRAIVTGPSLVPGLVAILSPLTASALQIRSGSVSRVRISVPSPVSERPAPGTVAAGSGLETADPDVNPAAAALAGPPVPAAASAVSAPAASALPADTAVPLSSVAQASADPLVPLAEAVPAPVTTTPAPAAAAFFAAEPAAPETPPNPAASDTFPGYTAPVLAAAEPEEPAFSVPEASEVPPAVETAPVGQTIFIDEPEVETAVVEEQPESLPGTIVPAPLPVAEELVDAEAAPDANGSGEAASPASAGYAVTLVPAEPNPPEAPAEPAAVFPEAAPVVAVVPAMVPGAVTPERDVPPAVIPSDVQEPKAVDLPFITSFAKGGYYVQIASYTDPVNAVKIVDSYGKKYPVAVERSSLKGGDVLKVFIGPVKKDEYGAVLERFKTLGFKDAFVKKGQ